jgi:hypothetical protein
MATVYLPGSEGEAFSAPNALEENPAQLDIWLHEWLSSNIVGFQDTECFKYGELDRMYV